jgi:site-specific DNA recombinase
VPERGVIYGRASKDPRGGGTSVSKQIERGREWATRAGVSIVNEVRDDNSSASRGSRTRPGFNEVRSLIERRAVDLLILWEASRSSRDLEEFTSLVNSCGDQGVSLVVSGTRYDPAEVDQWLPLMFQGVMSEAEARRIKKRNQDSVNTNAHRGTPHGRVPYGFRRVYDSRTSVLINQTPYVQADSSGVPVRDGTGAFIPSLADSDKPRVLSPEAQVLADAVEVLLAESGTLRGICRDLNERGVPSPRKPSKKTLAENPLGVAVTWDPKSLRQLLLNPTIAGRRVHQGVDIGEASWEPIVEYGTWLRLHAHLTDKSRLTVVAPRGPAPRHLLSRIATCGECGATLHAATNMSRIDRAYTCRAEGCMRVTVVAQRVDDMVEAVLGQYFGRADFRGALTAAFRRREDAIENGADLGVLIAEKEAELAEADALQDAGELSLRTYARVTKRIETEIEGLRSQQVVGVRSAAVRRLMTAESLAQGWEDADLTDRREVIRMLLRVKVNRATVRGRAFDRNRVKVTPGPFLTEG